MEAPPVRITAPQSGQRNALGVVSTITRRRSVNPRDRAAPAGARPLAAGMQLRPIDAVQLPAPGRERRAGDEAGYPPGWCSRRGHTHRPGAVQAGLAVAVYRRRRAVLGRPRPHSSRYAGCDVEVLASASRCVDRLAPAVRRCGCRSVRPVPPMHIDLEVGGEGASSTTRPGRSGSRRPVDRGDGERSANDLGRAGAAGIPVPRHSSTPAAPAQRDLVEVRSPSQRRVGVKSRSAGKTGRAPSALPGDEGVPASSARTTRRWPVVATRRQGFLARKRLRDSARPN